MRGKRRGLVDPSGADGPLFAALDAPREVSVGWAPRTSPEGRVPPGLRVVRPRFPGGGPRARGFFPPAPSGPLAETTSSARLETRTKESSVRASERVPNPSSAGKPRRCQSLLGRSIGRWGWPRPPPSAHQHARWDPKDGELCLSRAKPEETLVEARRCADVQIAFQTRV